MSRKEEESSLVGHEGSASDGQGQMNGSKKASPSRNGQALIGNGTGGGPSSSNGGTPSSSNGVSCSNGGSEGRVDRDGVKQTGEVKEVKAEVRVENRCVRCRADLHCTVNRLL